MRNSLSAEIADTMNTMSSQNGKMDTQNMNALTVFINKKHYQVHEKKNNMKIELNKSQDLILTPESEFDVFGLGVMSERINCTIDISSNNTHVPNKKVNLVTVNKQDVLDMLLYGKKRNVKS